MYPFLLTVTRRDHASNTVTRHDHASTSIAVGILMIGAVMN